jgi:coiled-coil domain-containing protein 12
MEVAPVVWRASRSLTSETFGSSPQVRDQHFNTTITTPPGIYPTCRKGYRGREYTERLKIYRERHTLQFLRREQALHYRGANFAMSSHEKLSAAANDRKSRLAQLKSLKRKQAPSNDEPDHESSSAQAENASALATTDTSDSIDTTVTKTYLSGRNFDPETRNVKLGFENQPISDPTSTLEYKAQQLALETKAQQDAERADENKGLDLFKLQPKKPNWDLKRDLEMKMKPLEVQTENAVARLVRERIEAQKQESVKQVGGGSGGGRGGNENQGDGEEVGMEGSELVEAMHLKEQEEERERRRDEADEDVS